MGSKGILGALGFLVGAGATVVAAWALGREGSDLPMVIVAAVAVGIGGLVLGVTLGDRRPVPRSQPEEPLLDRLDHAAAHIAGRRRAEAAERITRAPLTDAQARRRRGTAIGAGCLFLDGNWNVMTLHLTAQGYWFELHDGWGIPLDAETGNPDVEAYSLDDLDVLWRHLRFHVDPRRVPDREPAVIRDRDGASLFAAHPPAPPPGTAGG